MMCIMHDLLHKDWGNINVYIHICLYFKTKAVTVEEEMKIVSYMGRECRREFREREWNLNFSEFT